MKPPGLEQTGKGEDGSEEGRLGGEVRPTAKRRVCLVGRETKTGMEAAAQKGAMGPDWRHPPPPPPAVGLRAGTGRGKPAASLILEKE